MTCMGCPEDTVIPVPRWWERLDEWQHRHLPHGDLTGLVWFYAWRPFCNWRDRRYGRLD